MDKNYPENKTKDEMCTKKRGTDLVNSWKERKETMAPIR